MTAPAARVAFGQFAVLKLVHVVQGPGILEGGTGGHRADGRGVGAVGVVDVQTTIAPLFSFPAGDSQLEYPHQRVAR